MTPTVPLRAFEPQSVVVVRIGDPVNSAVGAANGIALPVYIDEYDTTGQSPTFATQTAMSSWAGPTSTCTMAQGKNAFSPAVTFVNWGAEGLPQLSTDGAWITFSCYRGFLPGQFITDTSNTYRTLARVNAIGGFDTSTYTREGYGGTAANVGGMLGVVLNAATNTFYYFFGPGK